MRKITLSLFGLLLALTSMRAQTSCTDLNGYVDSKNTAGTGAYTLQVGQEEMAAQTYHYAGPGKVSSVRVYGNYPGVVGGVPLRVGIYDVDANGRPTTSLGATNATWWWFDDFTGYINVTMPSGGINVSANFAVTVEVRTASPWGNTFQLDYTGNGEGLGADLASLAGTSTGGNWTSAMTAFNKDGDFYLVPRMTNFITSDFSVSSSCAATNQVVSFTNESAMTTDSMFNTIGLAAYSGNSDFYSWDFGDASAISHAVSPTHSYSVAGTYTVTLTCTIDGWNNDCSVSSTHVISVGLGVTASSVAANCYGSASGSVTLVGAGGTPPYTYTLNDGPAQNSGVFNNLSAGTYTGEVFDNMGCSSTVTVTVTQPSAIVITSINATNSSCGNADGSVLISATGGTGALQYQLGSSAFQSSGQFNNLLSDFYTVTVKDANGCTVSNYATVNDQGAPTLTITSQTNVSCYGGSNGTLVMIGTGGSGTLQYSINGGVTWQTSGSFLGLPAGTYLVMVKDASGCSYAVKITLSQPSPISFSASSTPVTCFGDNDGTISVSNAIGGTGTFSYSINSVNFQSSSVFTGVTAGTYTVTVRDIAGCTATNTVVVTQPTQVTATVTPTNATCFESYTGSITVNAQGGTPGYIYSINGESFQASNTFSELEAGTYTVIVRDANGCQISVNVTINQPTAIAATITSGSATCGNANGTLLVVASGGSGSGYTYSIDGSTFTSSGAFSGLLSGTYDVVIHDGAGCTNVFVANVIDANGPTITSLSHTNVSCYESADGTITINTVTGGSGTLHYSVDGSVWQLSPNFSGLDAGTYVVLVRDANGCVGSYTVTITQPTAIVVTTVTTNVICHGSASGTITVNAAGGSGALAYQIDGQTSYQSSNIFSTVSAGTWLIIVRDAAGCTGHAYCTITEPTAISINAGVLNVTCHGNNDGAIYVNGAGGTGTLTYSLDGITYQAGTTFTGLYAGVYTVYVKDANGCVETHSVLVSEPDVLTVNSIVSNVVCAGGNDGVIDLTVFGGTYPYSFAWSNGATTEDNFNLVAGNYSVTVTDENGCSYTQTFAVSQPVNPIIVNGVVTDATGQTATDGSVDITVTGGTAPYAFDWSNGATTEDISGVAPGVYLVTITDANGCVTSGVYVVSFSIGIVNHNVNSGAVALYPNPATENFTLDAGTVIIDKVEVMDILGQVIATVEPKTSKTQISTDGLAQGTYFVRLYINGGMITKRLEVSK